MSAAKKAGVTGAKAGAKAKAQAAAAPRLAEQLVLRDFLAAQLGAAGPDGASSLLADLAGKEVQRREDGQSNLLGVLEARTHMPMRADLARMDLNVMAHEARLRRHRAGFRLLYFQYLAALFTEAFLTLWARDPAGLLLALNGFLHERRSGAATGTVAGGPHPYADLPDFAPESLRLLTYWLATGAGKTLLMHMALLQFEHYAVVGEGTGRRIFTPDARILVTPSAALSAQHLREFAASGIEARPLGDVPAGFAGVQVLEITKLRGAGEAPKKSGGVTVPVSQFAGANLVLVDEGHKGAATKSDLNEENRWRSLRSELAGAAGFTLEYSATFAQVTETDKSGELRRAYAQAVAFEYAYGRFYRDGYGKDFGVLNLQSDKDEVMTNRVMLSGLLSLLEKRLAYDQNPEAAHRYNLAAPLMVFVGATVVGRNADSDVPTVLRFLHRVLAEPTWATAEIAALLGGTGGLQTGAGTDALHGTLGLLRGGRTPEDVYAELAARVFGGGGGLRLQRLSRTDSEIALWSASGTRPFGVITVGDPAKLLRNLQDAAAGASSAPLVSDDDPLSAGLFGGIRENSSPVNILVGSKMFIEGWSSWRVSVMGLLHVGRSAGAQVMQLFGRGVRLLGFGGGLKRSSGLEGEHPPEVAVQETLNLFGVKADYLQVLLGALEAEGVTPTAVREWPITVAANWQKRGLRLPVPDANFDFSQTLLTFKAPSSPVALNLGARLEVGRGERVEAGAWATETRPLGDVWAVISETEVLRAATAHKVQRGWANLYLPPAEVLQAARGATLTVRPDFFAPTTPRQLQALQAAAETAAQKAIDAFYIAEQRRAENERLGTGLLTPQHANFPKGAQYPHAYTLRVPHNQLAEVDALLADAERQLHESSAPPLPRLHIDEHLYAPLLTGPLQGHLGVTPAPLEPSEVRFVQHLRVWWAAHHAQPDWAGHELWLLRNLPKAGVGFFRTAGFYPDFLLWLTLQAPDASAPTPQALAFIDPKGIRQMHLQSEKFQLHTVLESRRAEFGFYATSFIVAQDLESAPLRFQASGTLSLEDLARDYHLLEQRPDGAYIAQVMQRLRMGLRGG